MRVITSSSPTSGARAAHGAGARSTDELAEAASYLEREWASVADIALRLPKTGMQSLEDPATMEAGLVHARNVIVFCCGNFAGRRDSRDIQPSDFLGQDWWPQDEEFDRRLRGRLDFINRELQHLSWQRVLDKRPLVVSMPLLAHEIHWGMHLFVEVLRHTHNDWLARFESHERRVEKLLPPLRQTVETKPRLAPNRPVPSAPSQAVSSWAR